MQEQQRLVCSECGAPVDPTYRVSVVHRDAADAADCANARGDRKPYVIDAGEIEREGTDR